MIISKKWRKEKLQEIHTEFIERMQDRDVFLCDFQKEILSLYMLIESDIGKMGDHHASNVMSAKPLKMKTKEQLMSMTHY